MSRRKHGEVVVYGAAYSVYVKVVRLVLKEKGVPYHLEEMDVFAEGGPPEDLLTHHPFARIPAFRHNDFCLFETQAIVQYVDEAFDGPSLMPLDPKERARVHQLISIMNSYAYRAMVWNVVVERLHVPESGGVSDEESIARGLRTAEICLNALDGIKANESFLVGSRLTIADLYVLPIIKSFRRAPEGAQMIAAFPNIVRWWREMCKRPGTLAVL